MSRSMTNVPIKLWALSLMIFVFGMQGCTTIQTMPTDPLAFKYRSQSSTSGDVTVTVAVPTMTEAVAIYGVELNRKFIQSVWVEVKNNSARTYWFLPSGLDPNYFSPSEAAFAFHTNSKEKNHQLDEKFHNLEFQNPVQPRSTRSGFVLVNLDEGFKAVDIDLISREDVKNFSFIVSDPDFKGDYKEVEFRYLYADTDIINIVDAEELRRALEALPCCTTNDEGDEHGDPLNVILVGEGNDILAALIRRNWHATEAVWSQSIKRTITSFLKGERYRYSPFSPLYVYGRRQEIGFQKSRGTIHERNHMRFWQTPIRYRGKKVLIGQISRDIGVKFTFKSPTISTHIIDPDVDEARRYFVEDMAYSQAVSQIGYVNGVGAVTKGAPRINLVGDPYYTDGLRAVLFFEPRPYSLTEIDLLDWESPPAERHKMVADAVHRKPVATEGAQIVKRALTEEKNGFRASTAVVQDNETKQIFGIDLARKKIQAIWIEIENNSDRPVTLLPTAIDPEYFSPLEVAFAYHKPLSKDANAELDEQILSLSFPTQSIIAPNSVASGYIFTNWSRSLKVINVDLLGRNFSQNFTFFVPDPDTSRGEGYIDRIESMFLTSELIKIDTEDELREALEKLPCCVSNPNGRSSGEPINVVVIGALGDWTTGFSRRGYRHQLLYPRYVFGRPQDLSGRKLNRRYVESQANAIRLWQTPMRYKGMPVWVGQTSSRVGGRFAENAPPEETLPIDPRVDRARNDLTQDLAYSQALTKIGHVKGAGRVPGAQRKEVSSENIQYTTDGRRVVLVFGDRPVSLAGIDFFDWERLND